MFSSLGGALPAGAREASARTGRAQYYKVHRPLSGREKLIPITTRQMLRIQHYFWTAFCCGSRGRSHAHALTLQYGHLQHLRASGGSGETDGRCLEGRTETVQTTTKEATARAGRRPLFRPRGTARNRKPFWRASMVLSNVIVLQDH